jgi:hypothetical protein
MPPPPPPPPPPPVNTGKDDPSDNVAVTSAGTESGRASSESPPVQSEPVPRQDHLSPKELVSQADEPRNTAGDTGLAAALPSSTTQSKPSTDSVASAALHDAAQSIPSAHTELAANTQDESFQGFGPDGSPHKSARPSDDFSAGDGGSPPPRGFSDSLSPGSHHGFGEDCAQDVPTAPPASGQVCTTEPSLPKLTDLDSATESVHKALHATEVIHEKQSLPKLDASQPQPLSAARTENNSGDAGAERAALTQHATEHRRNKSEDSFGFDDKTACEQDQSKSVAGPAADQVSECAMFSFAFVPVRV